MKTSDFYYDLPEELIAQTPANPRDAARMLVYDRATGKTEDRIFRDFPSYLHPSDVLVVNETRVIPARLLGVKEETGVPCEILLPGHYSFYRGTRVQEIIKEAIETARRIQ